MKNDHKQLCRKCKYAGRISSVIVKSNDPGATYFCDYAGHTGRCRSLICDAKDCTVYKPRGRQRKTTSWGFKGQRDNDSEGISE